MEPPHAKLEGTPERRQLGKVLVPIHLRLINEHGR